MNIYWAIYSVEGNSHFLGYPTELSGMGGKEETLEYNGD